jgi:hypothetical protein
MELYTALRLGLQLSCQKATAFPIADSVLQGNACILLQPDIQQLSKQINNLRESV